MELVCSSGKTEASIGDRYTDKDGEWEIVAFKDERTYSPSNIGGTPIVVVKPIGHPMPSWFVEYSNEDGTIDFCGDSVAAMILQNQVRRSAAHAAIF